MASLTEFILKSRSGVYQDTPENRRKHRVGQKYGAEKQPDEDDGKTEKKETDPVKELEAVNNVIVAINEGKLNLSAVEVIKLFEKKQKLEAVKKQVEKISAGVKVNKEKKNEAGSRKDVVNLRKREDFLKREVEELKEKISGISNKTIQISKREKLRVFQRFEKVQTTLKEVQEKLKGLGEKIEEEAKPDRSKKDVETDQVVHDINGIKVTVTKNFDGSYTLEANGKKVKSDDPSFFVNKTNLKPRVKRELAKEVGIEAESKSTDKKETKKKEEFKFEAKQGEDEESYTRVKFDDVPNSGKVNLKKYLSDKMKKFADKALGILEKVETSNLKKMEQGLVKEFNEQFDDLPKSRRAEKLYSIMKIKGELSKRGK